MSTKEVRLVSTENIKPSSPTPQHLRTHKLSFLDQLHPTIFSHTSLYFLKDNSNSSPNASQVLNQLKQSLSKTLTLFYPLAGRIDDDVLSIDCNDEGLYFSETKVNCNLSDFLRKLDLDFLNNFYPRHPASTDSYPKTHPVMIQANVFDCSGIVISMCLSHKILDGISMSGFLKGWAACAAGKFESVCPNFNSGSSLFPPADQLPVDSMTVLGRSMLKMGNAVTKRFLFDSSAIASLKSKAVVGSGLEYLSRVEVVSALIWKYAMAVSAAKAGCRRPSILSHAVDLRRRMVPPLDEYSIGNLLWIPRTQCTVDEDIELGSLVLKLRETIKNVNGDFVKKLQDGEGLAITSENVKEMVDLCSGGPVDYYGFTSWSKFGIYEIDFGWGKPVWVSSHRITGSVFTNLVHMLETKAGGGIEAWLTLDESEMDMLLADKEFLAFVSVDPSPLSMN